jgi:hypothetical protein
LAAKLKPDKERGTNYFPTKVNLFEILSEEYDVRFKELMMSSITEKTMNFEWLVSVFCCHSSTV